MRNVEDLAQHTEKPPFVPDKQPDPEELLFGTEDAPPLPAMNIFPIEWHVETPKLLQIYEQARDPGLGALAAALGLGRPERLQPRSALCPRLLVLAALGVRQLGPGGVRPRDDPHLRDPRGGPDPQVLLLDHPRRGQPRGGVRPRDPAVHPGRAARLRAADAAGHARPQQRRVALSQRRPLLGGLQEGRAQAPAAAPVHRFHVRRDRGRDPVPLDAPAHHDPGAKGGVPLHRPGRGAPSRHLPDAAPEGDAGARARRTRGA